MSSIKLWIYGLIVRMLPETRCFGLKASLLRWCGAKVGRNVRINSSARILGVGGLEIGDDVYVNVGCLIYAGPESEIAIGSCVDIGPNVLMATGTHEIDVGGDHVAGLGYTKSIRIGAGCWLGMGSKILPGVELKEKTVVAAGAAVTNSPVRGAVLLAGVPAEIKKIL